MHVIEDHSPAPTSDPKATNPAQIHPHIRLTNKPIPAHLLHRREFHPLVLRMGKEALTAPAAVAVREHVLAHLRLELAVRVGGSGRARVRRRAWLVDGSGTLARHVDDRGGRLAALRGGSGLGDGHAH